MSSSRGPMAKQELSLKLSNRSLAVMAVEVKWWVRELLKLSRLEWVFEKLFYELKSFIWQSSKTWQKLSAAEASQSFFLFPRNVHLTPPERKLNKVPPTLVLPTRKHLNLLLSFNICYDLRSHFDGFLALVSLCARPSRGFLLKIINSPVPPRLLSMFHDFMFEDLSLSPSVMKFIDSTRHIAVIRTSSFSLGFALEIRIIVRRLRSGLITSVHKQAKANVGSSWIMMTHSLK